MKTYCKPKQVNVEDPEFNSAAVHRAFQNGKLGKNNFRKLLLDTGLITREDLIEEHETQLLKKIPKAIDAVNLSLTKRIQARDLQLKPIWQFQRVDGISQKLRTLSNLSAEQQVLEYIAVDALMPLFRAKILHIQYGSIPGRGQTAGKRKIERLLRRKFHGPVDEIKGDMRHAYNSVTVVCCMMLLGRDIHKNEPLLWFVGAILANYPGGRLVIGGYLPTWLFNYVMSYVLRYLLSLAKSRRGVSIKLVAACVCYADDFSVYGRRSNLAKAIKKTARWCRDTLGMTIKPRWDIARLGSFAQEKAVHEMRKNGAHRRTDGINMMGFVVFRTYTIIRNRIFVRIRRQVIRASRELAALGYIPWWRAYKLTAYCGWLKHSDSKAFIRAYGVEKLRRMARKSISYHSKQIERRKEHERILCSAA